MQSLVPGFERRQTNHKKDNASNHAGLIDTFVQPSCKWMSRPQTKSLPPTSSWTSIASLPNSSGEIRPRQSTTSVILNLGIPSSTKRSQVSNTSCENPSVQLSWWISKSSSFSSEHRNAWVLSLILEQYLHEEQVSVALKKDTFNQRMDVAGLGVILDGSVPPRKRCKAIQASTSSKAQLLDENAQRMMIHAISRSIPAYISGIRCWGAFCDALDEGRFVLGQAARGCDDVRVSFVLLFNSTSP